ncbi:MAG: hypothetical protein ACOVP1_06235 [Bacteroidia bacterium]
MKTNLQLIRSLCLVVSLMAMIACEKNLEDSASTNNIVKCTPNALPDQYKAVFVSDQIPNQVEPNPIAIFQFTQGMKTYSNTNCKNLPNACSTSLRIQNISGRKMRIAYTIEYLQGNNYWSSDGFANIAKDSIFNAGVVSTNCGWITSEGLKVVKKSVVFE